MPPVSNADTVQVNQGKRKLAAIMFTDIVGYSRMSHKHEALALELLGLHRALVRPILEQFQGLEIKTIGDAFLVKFESAIEAANCAVEIQRTIIESNARTDAARRIHIRIGIHLGDILYTEQDVYGDGVNIAARLLYLARPDGICISSTVFDQVHNKLDCELQDIGGRKLKNIEKRIRVYRLLHDIPRGNTGKLERLIRFSRRTVWKRAAAGAVTALAVFGLMKWLELGQPRRETQASNDRIAVLPFANLSGDPEDEYISDGFTDELISGLARGPGSRVIARSSIQGYKGTKKSASVIGAELKVETLVEGSVRRMGPKLRVTVQLTNARTEEGVWSREFEGTASELFSIQKRIAVELSSYVRGRTAGRSLASIAPHAEPSTDAPQSEAYQFYLKGKYFNAKRTEDGLKRGEQFFRKAIALDPKFALPYAALSSNRGLMSYYGYMSPKEAEDEGETLSRKALALDPNLADALVAVAEQKGYYEHHWEEAQSYFEKALYSSPGNATAHQWYGEFLISVRNFPEAERQTGLALELDPLSLTANTAAGLPLYYQGKFDSAERHFRSAQELDSNFGLASLWLGRTYVQQGKFRLALQSLEKARSLSPGSPMIEATYAHALARSGEEDRARKILSRLLALPKGTYVPAYSLAGIYAGLGDKIRALDYLDKANEEKSDNLIFVASDPVFQDLAGEPRFKELLRSLAL